MSIEEKKAICRRIVDEVNKRNLDTAIELIASDYVDHSDPPGTSPGPLAVKQRFTMLCSAFPDLRVALEDMVAEGDRVAVRFTLHGTHYGDFMGMSPTGKHVTVSGIDINRIRDGKLVERWASVDMLGMLQQLGAIPEPAQTP